jgi:anthranilate synthase/aminodeoxychorismate synthase-like glutamine amidotransferase
VKIAFIDNFDSFTFNLVHCLEKAGAKIKVYHNCELFEFQSQILKCNGVLIGPGPNTPKQSGELLTFLPVLIEARMPILGVCLGQQVIGEYFGMNLIHAKIPMHGKSSEITHNGVGVFSGIQSPIRVGRYHSLLLEQTVKSEENIEILAYYEGEIMSIQHKELPIVGVQFHPESVLTPLGQKILDNWISGLIL